MGTVGSGVSKGLLPLFVLFPVLASCFGVSLHNDWYSLLSVVFSSSSLSERLQCFWRCGYLYPCVDVGVATPPAVFSCLRCLARSCLNASLPSVCMHGSELDFAILLIGLSAVGCVEECSQSCCTSGVWRSIIDSFVPTNYSLSGKSLVCSARPACIQSTSHHSGACKQAIDETHTTKTIVCMVLGIMATTRACHLLHLDDLRSVSRSLPPKGSG